MIKYKKVQQKTGDERQGTVLCLPIKLREGPYALPGLLYRALTFFFLRAKIILARQDRKGCCHMVTACVSRYSCVRRLRQMHSFFQGRIQASNICA